MMPALDTQRAPPQTSVVTHELNVGPHVLRWTERGEGERVVLVHSSGMSSRQWRRIAEALEPRYRVVLPDLLGYGESSPWPREERFHFTMDLLALEALIDRLVEDGGPVHLAGHSYGGFLAMLAALHRPTALRSVAVYEPVSFGVLRSKDDEEALATILPGDDAAPFPDSDEALEAWLERFIDYWNGVGGWRALAEPMRQQFRATGRKVVGEVRSLGADRTPHQAYATVEAPLLLLGSEKPTLAAERVLAILEASAPRARRVPIAGAGHMGPLTHAGAVAGAMSDHFAGVGPAPR
jgi:pimeloyl-ACP methyl ester carboxylesterase